ncbi:hypothetical protein IWQ62_002355, partial [Dispira parvispora]
VAEVGLTTYRNLNLIMIISHVIHSSELQVVFDQFSCLTRPLQERVQRITLNPANPDFYQTYEQLLRKVLTLPFSNAGPSDSDPVNSARVFVVPSLSMHRTHLANLYSLYTAIPGNSSQLTDVGAEKLQSQRDLLGATRGSHQAFENLGIAFPLAQKPTYRSSTPILPHLSKPARLVSFDLATLGPVDLSAHHWLLTRPFLTPIQTLQEVQTLVGSVKTNGHGPQSPDFPLASSSVTDTQGVDDAPATSRPIACERVPSPVETRSNQSGTSPQTPALSPCPSPEPTSRSDQGESVASDTLPAPTGTALGLTTEVTDTRPEVPHTDVNEGSVTSSVEDFLVHLDQHLQGSPLPQSNDVVNKSPRPTETKSEVGTPPDRIPTPLGQSTSLAKYLFKVSPEDGEEAFVYPDNPDKESDKHHPDSALLPDEAHRSLPSQVSKPVGEGDPVKEVCGDTTDESSHRERSNTMASEQSELQIDLQDLLVAATASHTPTHEIQTKESHSPSPLRHSVDSPPPQSITNVTPATSEKSEPGDDQLPPTTTNTLVSTTNTTQPEPPTDTARVGETVPTVNALSLSKEHTAEKPDPGCTGSDDKSDDYYDDSDDDDDDHETMVISFADLAVRTQKIPRLS